MNDVWYMRHYDDPHMAMNYEWPMDIYYEQHRTAMNFVKPGLSFYY